MDEIKNWAFSVCSALICGSVLNMLVPEGSFQKIFKCVLNIFMICTIVTSFKHIEIPNYENIKDFFSSSSEISGENIFLNNSATNIEEQIKIETADLLRSEGIIFNDISIKINISQSGSIDINKFTLNLENENDFIKIKEKVKQKIGIEPEIIVSGENANGNS